MKLIREHPFGFLFGAYCFMVAGLTFGEPPTFLNNLISMSVGRLGSTVSENAYPWTNSFQALMSTIGLPLTFLFYLGVFFVGFRFCKHMTKNQIKELEIKKKNVTEVLK